MRRIHYAVAMSLDGYIAGPNGEYDWIVIDPEIKFGEIYERFDTLLMGRKTFELMTQGGGNGTMPGTKTVVVSSTLRPEDYPAVTVVSDHVEETVAQLRAEPGKDIWLFGGGVLFRSLLEAGLVDNVDVAVIPVLLGGGVPLLPPPAGRAKLRLVETKLYKKTGTLSLEYAVELSAKAAKPSRGAGARKASKRKKPK